MIDQCPLQQLANNLDDPNRCRYHCIDRSSDYLLVSVGDSFTYGCGLEPNDIKDHYGSFASRQMGWDWMNAGCKGGSNSWTINVLEKSVDFFNASKYHRGALIITLTENGRDVNEGKSRPFDYFIYQDREIDLKLFDTVLDDCEDEWIQRLCRIRTELDQRFEIIIGTNFCWHDRLFSALGKVERGIRLLPNTWIECLSSRIHPPRIRTTNTVWPNTLLQILGKTQDKIYKQWIVNKQPEISCLFEYMAKLPEYFCQHDPGHPNSIGHEIWARQILSVITKEKFAHPV